MKYLPFLACLSALVLPLCAYAQFPPSKPMPSVARPGPGDTNCQKPQYPQSSLRNEEQGTVTLRFLVDKDGAILDGHVMRTSGFYELDKAALVALAKCAYKIPEDAQEPQWKTLQYVFSLGLPQY